MVAEANTAITNNCNGNLVTNVLEYEGSSFNFSTPSEAYCYAKSDKPVFVVILGVGSTLNDGNIGDPVMSIVPPIDHYTTSNILFYIPNYSDFNSHYINIISTEPNPEIMMNEQALSLNWTTINGNDRVPAGYAAQMYISAGVSFIMDS